MGEGQGSSLGPCLIFFVLIFVLAKLCGMWILVPHPGIKLVSSAVEAQSLNYLTAREIPKLSFCVGGGRGGSLL